MPKHFSTTINGRFVRWIGNKSGADKNIAQGGTALVPFDEWCDLSEIQGHDPDVLRSQTINRAFERIVATWKPRHDIALVSLCTSTRPYSLSRKWSEFLAHFSGSADLIIHSNGGIIPIEYECQFPFLNYNAHGESRFDDEYIEVGIRRMKVFFTNCRYRHVLFNFRHNMRNCKIASDVGPWLKAAGLIEQFAIIPTKAHYETAQAKRFHLSGFKMFPELYPEMFNPLKTQIRDWKTHKSNCND